MTNTHPRKMVLERVHAPGGRVIARKERIKSLRRFPKRDGVRYATPMSSLPRWRRTTDENFAPAKIPKESNRVYVGLIVIVNALSLRPSATGEHDLDRRIGRRCLPSLPTYCRSGSP